MTRHTRLMMGALLAVLSACDTPSEPEVPGDLDRSEALVHNSVAYPFVDAQIQRLYTFNNCLTGIGIGYLPAPQCPVADMTYEVATVANNSLAAVFPPGFGVDANAARTAMANYVALIDGAYSVGRVTCRARDAIRQVAAELDTVFIDILAGRPVDLSKLPQPLDADLMSLNLLNSAACQPESPLPAVTPAGGYSLFALNSSCSDGGRSIDISGDNFFAAQSTHSNASLRVQGQDDILDGNTTYGCSASSNASAYIVAGPTQVAPRAAPITLTRNDFACSYSRNGNWNLNGNGSHWIGGTSASRRLQPGVYCSTGNITLSVDYVSGNVTLVANGNVDVGSDYAMFRAYQHDVTVYANGNSNSAVTFDGMAPSLVGHVYAPRGRVNGSGYGFTVNGTIVAEQIRINADDANVVAAGAAN